MKRNTFSIIAGIVLVAFIAGFWQVLRDKNNFQPSVQSASKLQPEQAPMREIKSNENNLPSNDDPIVLRTDFSNETKWKSICNAILTPDPEYGYFAFVVFCSDRVFEKCSTEELLHRRLGKYNRSFIFLVDSITIASTEHPVLCLGLKADGGKQFRVIPSQMWGVENNLSISNMDFNEFVIAADGDGVFRGFRNK
jgi:hypothetical protein